jgi:hypothetical protein
MVKKDFRVENNDDDDDDDESEWERSEHFERDCMVLKDDLVWKMLK